MKRIVWWVVGIGVVCGLFAVWYGRAPEPTTPASRPGGENASQRTHSPTRTPPKGGEHPVPAPARPSPAKAGVGPQASPPSIEARLAALKKSMPRGKPKEWRLCRPLYEGKFMNTPQWVWNVITSLEGRAGGPMVTQPYYVMNAFGASDLKWLQSVEKNCIEASTQAHRDAGVDSNDRAHYEQWRIIRDRVYRRFAQLLEDEATRRVENVPELAAKFRDTRRVCDMPPGSKERQWALALVRSVVQLSRWKADPVYRITEEDLQYLSPADLAQVARWKQERFEALWKYHVTEKNKDEYIRVIRPIQRKLFDLIRQRAGE